MLALMTVLCVYSNSCDIKGTFVLLPPGIDVFHRRNGT